MQLKNKVERERFLDDYKTWELWKEIPELELKFYRKNLSNGTMIVATEFSRFVFNHFSPTGAKYNKSTDVKYHLLLSKSDNYKIEYSEHSFLVYNPSGDSKSALIEYLTKVNPEV